MQHSHVPVTLLVITVGLLAVLMGVTALTAY